MSEEKNKVGEVWRRASEGRHSAVIGLSLGDPPVSLGLRVVRVSCDVPASTLGPLIEARRKVEQILGGAPPLFDQARQLVVSGLRRRLLGDALPGDGSDDAIVETLNRLARHEDKRSALLFDAVDAADEATLDALRAMMSRDGWLKLPVILSFRAVAISGRAEALLDAFRAGAGPSAVFRAPLPEQPPAHSGEPKNGSRALDLRALPPDILRVLRAGALIGSGFEDVLVAALLRVDPLDVIENIQRAVDAGVPVDDRGEGRFHLPDALVDELRGSLLPSLARSWHRRLAAILTGEGAAKVNKVELDQNTPVEPSEASAEAPSAPPPAAPWQYSELYTPSASSAPEPANESAPEPDPAPVPVSAPVSVSAPVPAPVPVPVSVSAPVPVPVPVTASAPDPAPEAASNAPAARDEVRAAGHLSAAGEIEAAAERYAEAVRTAADAGAYTQALMHGKRALELLDELPSSPRRRRVRVGVLAELGRIQWLAAGPELPFTLAGALEALESARAFLADGDPAELRAEVSVLIAGVCYDLGDMRSLERALAELTFASRLLMAAGDSAGAARLLNDQAAVYVRMGDPVRATHLLGESKKVFEKMGPNDPVAMVELAETDHLFARIPLHVAARPGREQDALTMGIDHALAAERTYRKIGAARELGRVWETIGRLELKKGRLERAAERLASAMKVQRSIGDVLGLARTTAVLSEVLAASGRYRDALALLGDSIALNLEKGSPIGLAFNRRSLDAVAKAAPPKAAPRELLNEVASRLMRAEAAIGRVKLPGERD